MGDGLLGRRGFNRSGREIREAKRCSDQEGFYTYIKLSKNKLKESNGEKMGTNTKKEKAIPCSVK